MTDKTARAWARIGELDSALAAADAEFAAEVARLTSEHQAKRQRLVAEREAVEALLGR